MKTIDIVLIAIVILMLFYIMSSFMGGSALLVLFRILMGVILFFYFVYMKLKPYADKLDPKYKDNFDKMKGVFDAVTAPFQSMSKLQVGPGLVMDVSQLIVCAILIILVII